MQNKNLYIALGVLALAGIAVYLYKRDKKEDASEKKEKFSGASGAKVVSNILASKASGVNTCPRGTVYTGNGCTPVTVSGGSSLVNA
jgi:hypothetical protein